MTLAAKLEEIKKGVKEKIPAETFAKMEKATTELRSSGIMQRALSAGSALPDFELPDENGDLISSNNLLTQGPLVLTFYRGSW